MSLLRKIGAAIRGTQHDAMQNIVDAQAIRILEQEIRDCQKSVAKAKAEMVKVVAERKATEREIEQLNERTARIEQRAMTALGADDETLAINLSGQIADLEVVSEEQQKHHQQMRTMEEMLRSKLLAADRQINQHLQELRLARAINSTQTAFNHQQAKDFTLSQQLEEVKSSVARIRKRQQQSNDLDDATATVEQLLNPSAELDADRRSQDVLQRLRQRTQQSETI